MHAHEAVCKGAAVRGPIEMTCDLGKFDREMKRIENVRYIVEKVHNLARTRIVTNTPEILPN